MIVDELKKSILQIATEGKIVRQNYKSNAKEELEKILKESKEDKKYNYILVEEIPFSIPNNWVWVKLEDICLKITDGTHSTPKYANCGVPFISVKDISDGFINFNNTKFITQDEHNKLFLRCNPKYGDLLITKVGTTGIPAIVETTNEFSVFVSVALLKFNQKLINNIWLYYFLKSPIVQKQVKENTRGVGNKNWVLDAIKNTIIPLPPLEEQQRIVNRIEELFFKLDEIKIIENELNIIKNGFSNEIKKSILSSFFKDTPDVNKEKLSAIVSFSNIKNSECGEYKYLEVKYLRGNTNPKILKKGKYVEKNSLSILVDGENSGEIFKIPENGYLGSTLKSLNVSDKILEKYLIYYLMLKKEYFKSNKRGSAIPHLDKNLFFNSMIYLPSIKEQQRIVDKLEQLLPLCNDIEKLINGKEN